MLFSYLRPRGSYTSLLLTTTFKLANYNRPRSICVLNHYFNAAKVDTNRAAEFHQNISKRKTFHEIFRFPAIRVGYYVQKLKWYQTLSASAAIPISLVLYLFSVIDTTWVLGVFIPGCLLTINLYGFGSVFYQAIGFIYLSEDETTLKISYLDFWGNRINEEFPVNDVMPFMDAPRPPTELMYKQLVFFSRDKFRPKLFFKLGHITDSEKFLKVFGPLN